MLTVKALAKINLTLDVLYKRPDGYHEVAMIMQAIDLADKMVFLEQPEGITLAVNISGLACDHTNLAYRAAALLKERYGVRQGVRIELEKNIPLAAGLAGGSADAAGVLAGLNRLWRLGLKESELEALGAALGSDVPFCLRGGTALATGRGEALTSLPDMPECYVVLAKPPFAVSTAWVYQNYRAERVRAKPDTAGTLACLKSQDLNGIAHRLSNVLESVTIPSHPEIGQLKEYMIQYGAIASLMSGSGPTVFGLAGDYRQAGQIAEKLRCHTAARVIITKTVKKVERENGKATFTD